MNNINSYFDLDTGECGQSLFI